MPPLLKRLLAFRDARDWKQFHTPRNLATALSSEVGELLEVFRWKNDNSMTEEERKKIESEVADIYIFLLFLADNLGVDLEKLASDKMDVNEGRYTVEKSKGTSKKYTEL